MLERLFLLYVICWALIAQVSFKSARACIGGGGGGGSACCPSRSAACAPALPICSSSYGYSSYSGGGSYAAPVDNYPRPLYSPGCATTSCSSSKSGYSSSSVNNYVVPPVSNYQAPLAAAVALPPPASSYQLPPLIQAPPPPPPSYQTFGAEGSPPPDPVPGPELENTYDEINHEHSEAQQPPPEEPPSSNSELLAYSDGGGDTLSAAAPVAQSPYGDKPLRSNDQDHNTNSQAVEATNSVAVPATAIQQPDYSGGGIEETDGGGPSATAAQAEEASSLNCDDADLRKIVERALLSSADNLEVARKIESEAAEKFGGRFNSIVSNSEFAYVNWYGKRNCQLRVNDRHSLTWED